MQRLSAGFVILLLASPSVVAQSARSVSGRSSPTEQLVGQEYERYLESYKDWTFEQLQQHLGLAGDKSTRLSFDPDSATYYASIRRALKMTEEEQAAFKRNGMVVIDPGQRHGFGSVYYHIYASDLPVLVTADSVLHAWHHSYDALLAEFEGQIFVPLLAELLKDCHEQLAKDRLRADAESMSDCYQDVDLYLTVARNLLAGAGGESWNGSLIVPTKFESDDQALERLEDVRSLKLQVQNSLTPSTKIYGGERFIDYSQFRPRGHYTTSKYMKDYFRCLTWLSRADCGFHVLPVDPVAGIWTDWRRELRDAALLSQLIRETNNHERLNAICGILQLLIGETDNLTVSGMLEIFESERIETAAQLADGDDSTLEKSAEAIRASGKARQRIRSQAVVSNVDDTHKVPPPATFQMLGQLFTLDSFLLSHSVFDSIIFEERKQKRMMPSGLDVAAVLGNDHAVMLLEPDLREWKYSANLLAGRDFVEQLKPAFWNGSVYHRWLDALRTLDDRPTGDCVPQVMQSSAWRAKQLQTQLASWSELRQDSALYGKQSYTSVVMCQYPDGFVEPYPELYRKLHDMAISTAARLAELEIPAGLPRRPSRQRTQDLQFSFLHRFAEIMSQLEVIATQELAGQPMTDEQRLFIETTIDLRGTQSRGSGRIPQYNGWYCDLLYAEDFARQWNPTMVDVHTDPSNHTALHVGVGDVNFMVVAVDSQDDVAAYVGPVYSFYEFTQPAEQRLDNEQWQQMIVQDKLPPRPDWTRSFIAPPAKRSFDGISLENLPTQWVVTSSVNGVSKQVFDVSRDDQGLRKLLEWFNAQGTPSHFGVCLNGISKEGLQSLKNFRQLSWIDLTDSTLPAESIEDFRRLRPDVAVLPGDFRVKTAFVCRRIDGLRRFQADSSGKLQPGVPLLLYLEPASLTWSRRVYGFVTRLEATVTLRDASGDVVTTAIADPVSLTEVRPGEPVYTQVQVAVPDSLERGVYDLEVELKDGLSQPADGDDESEDGVLNRRGTW